MPSGKPLLGIRKMPLERYHKGYVMVLSIGHPFAFHHRVQRARLVMEKIIGRYLLPIEIVHHINEIKDDDEPNNLKLCSCKSEHIILHNNLREYKKGRKHTLEESKKISKANSQRIWTEESKRKLSESCKKTWVKRKEQQCQNIG